MNYKLTALIPVTFVFCLFSLIGEGIDTTTSVGTEFAYYPDNNQGYGQIGGFVAPSYSPVETPGSFTPALNDYSATEPRTLGSGWGAVKFQTYLKHRIKIPFLQGEGSLLKDNNATVNFDLYVAPVAVYGRTSVTITPIAFLNFNIGGLIGTGWNASLFNGLGDNVNGEIMTKSFPGVVLEVFSSASLQFDLAALLPGKWNHVVAVTNFKFTYSYFTSQWARDGGPWQWLADDGENLNGMKFEGTYFLGYQMPLTLDTVGFLVETEQMIGKNYNLSTMADNGWGSDFVSVTFGPMCHFTFNEHNSLAVLFQFSTNRDYTDSTIFNQYYQNRVYEGTFVKWDNVSLAYDYKF